MKDLKTQLQERLLVHLCFVRGFWGNFSFLAASALFHLLLAPLHNSHTGGKEVTCSEIQTLLRLAEHFTVQLRVWTKLWRFYLLPGMKCSHLQNISENLLKTDIQRGI